MNQGTPRSTVIAGIIAFVIIAGVVGGTIIFKKESAEHEEMPSGTSITQSTDNTSTTAVYKDGTYTAAGDYQTQESIASITVTITISGGTVTDSSVAGTARSRESKAYIADFIAEYKDFVEGKQLGSLQVSRIAGASLTSRGFNEALNAIRSQAQS